jgi:hypothetical protein
MPPTGEGLLARAEGDTASLVREMAAAAGADVIANTRAERMGVRVYTKLTLPVPAANSSGEWPLGMKKTGTI